MENLEFLEILSDAEKTVLLENTITESANRGDTIYDQYSNKHFVHYLVEGEIKYGKILSNNIKTITSLVYTDNFFGIKPLLKQVDDMEYAEALTKVTYLKINPECIREIMNANSMFTNMIFHQIYSYINKLEKSLEQIHYSHSVKERVIRFLIEFANNTGKRIGQETLIKINLTQSEIAEFVFVSRQSVSEVMIQLKKEDLIHYDRVDKVLIRDLDELKSLINF